MATAIEKEVKKVKRDFLICLLLILGMAGLLSGCGKDFDEQGAAKSHSEESQESRTEEEGAVREENSKESRDKNTVRIIPTSEITELEIGLSMARYVGTSDWRLPIYERDDDVDYSVLQYYDIPSR